MSDQLTVLCAHSGVLTKRVSHTADGWQITPYADAKHFAVRSAPIAGFAKLAETLTMLTNYPRCAVIRGEPLPGTDLERCRRLLHPCRESGDAATFAPAPRRWLAIDFDSVPEPAALVFAAEPEDAVEHVLGLLPEPFADVSCWWQATGSAGVKPGIRVRTWHWLSRPLDDAEAKGWLAPCPVDRTLYGAVTLHYTASPILAQGTSNPVARRFGVRQAPDEVVEVPAVLPRIEQPRPVEVTISGHELSDDALVALGAAVRRSGLAQAIWTGERAYPDRSGRHHAFGCELARAGVRDARTLAAALVALDEHLGVDLGKISRPDYLARTVGSILAAEGGR